MFVSKVFDVLDELGGVDDVDVIGEADDEATDTAIVGDEGIEEPMRFVHLEDVVLSHGELLDEEAVGPHSQAQPDTIAFVARHAEDIDEALTMRMAMLPRRRQDLSVGDAGGLEGLVLAVFEIIAPDFSIVGGEAERLHVTVADGGRVGGSIIVEDDLPVLLDGFGHRPDVAGVFVFDGAFGQAQHVDECAELAAKVGLEEGVVVDVVECFAEDVGFFGGEVHHLGEVFRFFGGKAVAATMVNDWKSAFLQVIEVTIDGGG